MFCSFTDILIESKKSCAVYEIKFIPKANVIYICWVSTLWYYERLVNNAWMLFCILDSFISFLKFCITSNFHMSFTAKHLLPGYSAEMMIAKHHLIYFCVKYHFHVVTL